MLPSGLAEAIDDGEDLARFLTQDGHYSSQARMAKPAAFLPNPKDRETSVMRHGREPREQLWRLGHVAAGDRRLRGVVFLLARQVRALALAVLADEPPPRHAAIRGWPWSDGDPAMAKARQKELAIQLASAASELLTPP